jgi:hypothetical protein
MLNYTDSMVTEKKIPRRVRVPRGKSPRGGGEVDRKWIQSELERIYGTGWNRKGAAAMGIDPSDLTRLARGQRRWTAEYVSRLQHILRRPLDEIYRKVGVSMPPAPTPEHVRVAGIVDERGRIQPNGPRPQRHVPAPPGVLESYALLVRAPLSPVDGWILYYDPRPENPATLIGRLAVIRIKNNPEPVLGVLRRGTLTGMYSILAFVGEPVADTEIEVDEASPVIWVKAG